MDENGTNSKYMGSLLGFIQKIRTPSEEGASANDQPKPCPFCGEVPDVVPWHGGGPDKHMVCCSNHNCAVLPSVSGDTRKKAVAVWNCRTDPTPGG